jgi:hypothetical protein
MSDNILNQLAAMEVPAPPDNLDQVVHQSVNRWLLGLQLLNFLLRAIPTAAAYFACAMAGAIYYTLVGVYPKNRESGNANK